MAEPERTSGGDSPGGGAAVHMRGEATSDGADPAEVPPVKPMSARAERTRAALLRAARVIFERDGFLAARITDIADEASVAHGTFYSYFTSKEEIFKAVASSIQEEQFSSPQRFSQLSSEDPLIGIERANRRYLSAYQHNAALM